MTIGDIADFQESTPEIAQEVCTACVPVVYLV